MATMTHDAQGGRGTTGAGAPSPVSRIPAGLVFALVSARSFGLAGSVARGLLDTGWSPGATVLVRVTVAAIVVLLLGLVALRSMSAWARRCDSPWAMASTPALAP